MNLISVIRKINSSKTLFFTYPVTKITISGKESTVWTIFILLKMFNFFLYAHKVEIFGV